MKRRQFLVTASALVLCGASGVKAAIPAMTVYKDPACGCCEAWAKAMARSGLAVDIRPVEDLAAIKRRHGVPADMEGCHTAVVGDYFLEGHVPLEAVERLLKQRPAIRGLAVPGMPEGSLGMGDDPTVASYDVWSVARDGSRSVFMSVRPQKA